MSGKVGHRGGGERLPILPSHLWDGPTGLPPRSLRVLMCPLHLLMGNISLATLLAIPPNANHQGGIHPCDFLFNHPVAPTPSPGSKQWHHLPNQAVSSPQSGDKTAGGLEEPPHQKWKDEMPLKKSLKGGQWEAFAKDSDLVQQATEDYFRTNHPHFDWDLMWSLWSILGHDCICQPPMLWHLWNPRGLDRVGGLAICQWCIEDFTKGPAVLPTHITLRIAQGHGPERHSSPGCPSSLCQANLLPLVRQGGPEWRNCGQPLEDNTLQARANCN